MHEDFANRICAGLPGAKRTEPFGPGTVIWIIDDHMFAAYTEDGEGLSIRTTGRLVADKLVREGRAVSAVELQGDGWVLLPWTTPPEELRERIERSFRLVQQDGNSRLRGARSARGKID